MGLRGMFKDCPEMSVDKFLERRNRKYDAAISGTESMNTLKLSAVRLDVQ
jgi:hypothetical protein